MVESRIALIHATPIAIEPVTKAFNTHWSEATVTSLLDDSLSLDLERAGKLDASIIQRFVDLGDYVVRSGADAILFTCSAFGPAIDRVKQAHKSRPVLKPNEAMFEEALEKGDKIGMLATFQPSIAPMEEEFYKMAESTGRKARIETIWVKGAMDALVAGKTDRHNDLIADVCDKLDHCDAVMLAHFSTAKAKQGVMQRLNKSILTSPESAVNKLKSTIHAYWNQNTE